MHLERVGPNWIRGANSPTAVRKSKAPSWPDVGQHSTISRRAFCGLDRRASDRDWWRLDQHEVPIRRGDDGRPHDWSNDGSAIPASSSPSDLGAGRQAALRARKCALRHGLGGIGGTRTY